MTNRPHLQQIADLLNVSKMTVSRALREGTSVNPELRAKIREIATRIRYQPDSRISELMSEIRKSRTSNYRETLAFVWTHSSAKQNRDYFFYEGFEGARARAEELGFKLDQFHLKREALTGRALTRILRARGIRGVLIAPPVDQRPHPHAWLDWRWFCSVLMGRSMANTGLARVQHDHFAGTVSALRHLRKLHYQRIGLVLAHSMDERSFRQVRSAFLGFYPQKTQSVAKLIYTNKALDLAGLREWIQKNRPEAIMTNLEEPFPTLEQLRPILPKSMRLVSLNWSNEQPEIAGIMQQRSIMGKEAVDLLLRRLEQNQLGLDPLAPTIMIPGSWIDGISVR